MSRPRSDSATPIPGLGPRGGIPRLAPTVDWSTLQLDDVRGFVLSRIDGRTTIGEILLLAPFPEAQTVAILVELHAKAVIEVPGVPRPAPTPPPPRQAPPTPPLRPTPIADRPVPAPTLDAISRPAGPAGDRVATPQITIKPTVPTSPVPRDRGAPIPVPPASLIPPAIHPPRTPATTTTPEIPRPRPPATPSGGAIMAPAPSPPEDDLAPEVRARIDEMFAVVGDDSSAPDPHRLLGLQRGADRKDIKRAYFKLSKEFHPDRHFNRSLGVYKRRLQRIFNAIKDAYEILDGAARGPR